ncbi:Peroxisomal ATPase PEX1-like protein [Drosera capensis]
MEYKVRQVGGLQTCDISLPISLIQTLDSTSRSPLPPVLVLELRPVNSETRDRRHPPWVVAWCGAASSSGAIEIAQEFADCINLPDGVSVVVRALPYVPKAAVVTIEPLGEDDWEVMELMAETAEAVILKQVRIVHQTMKFPLWLHGHSIVTFCVVSTDPATSIVQLVPGTEVAVAPKTRKRYDDYSKDSILQSLDGTNSVPRVLLRVQAPKDGLMQKSKLNDHDVEVELTTVALIHPETAKDSSFDPLQVVVILPRLLPRVKSASHDTPPKKQGSTKELSGSGQSDDNYNRYAIVHLVPAESAARSHLVISQSLRHYLRVTPHSCMLLLSRLNFHFSVSQHLLVFRVDRCMMDEIFRSSKLSGITLDLRSMKVELSITSLSMFAGIYVQTCSWFSKIEIPSFSISSCRFAIPEKKMYRQNNVFEVPNSAYKPKSVLHHSNSEADIDTNAFAELNPAISSDFMKEAQNDSSFSFDGKKDLCGLIDVWLRAQLHAINCMAGVEAASLFLGHKTFIHFVAPAESSRYHEKLQISSVGPINGSVGNGNSINEHLYLLNVSGKLLRGEQFVMYEVMRRGQLNDKSHGLDFLLENLVIGDPLSFNAVREKSFSQTFNSTLSSLSWMGTAISEVIHRLLSLVSPASMMWFSSLNLPFPGHVLLYGPPGSGKTLLASAAAKFLEEDAEVMVHVVFVSCSALTSENLATVQQLLGDHVSDALDHVPSLVIFDDLDSIISSSVETEGSQPTSSVVEKRNSTCGFGPIAFIACVHDLNSIPLSLRASGRFDFHVQLLAPAASERMAILEHEISKRSLECSDDILQDVASKCDGYDAYDLAILVDRSIHAAVPRFLPPHLASSNKGNASLILDDFTQAMHEFVPVSMRDITKGAPDAGRSGWDDVGGLLDVRNSIKEMIELPSKFPDIFAKCPLRLRSNVLLYGPPGCGKTHLVGAAAAAASLRFISIKGPELLNKYIGASEQAVRDIFSKAAAAAPCLLFFDEFDSIAPKRGHDNTGVTDRVVNQFLTELDGVEILSGVFVFAATSRPDLLDAALLRPGRLDRLLFCDFPSVEDRLDILAVLSRKLPLADDVELAVIAQMTEGFSGADLQALVSDAQLAAVQELLDDADSSKSGRSPVITDSLLRSVTSRARPSVSESEKRRLYNIYSQFLDSKKSVSAQSRDTKGKRATLA